MAVRVACLVLLCFVVSSVNAQDKEKADAQEKEIAKTVLAQLKKLNDASLEGKYDIVVELTHPKVVKSLGGKEKAKRSMKGVMDKLKEMGLTIQATEVGKPTVMKGEKDYFAVVPCTMVITGEGVKVTSTAAVVGVSTDGGKAWVFVNVTSSGEKGVRETVPDLPPDLKVPTPKEEIEQKK
jgi:hypothetical protein